MSGILLLAVVVGWLALSIMLSAAISRLSRGSVARTALAAVSFSVLLPLPIADELIGGYQFRQLCAANAVLRVGVPTPEGRTTKVVIQPANARVPGTAIPIFHSYLEYVDIRTGESVVSFSTYVAKGGLLIRSLGISENNSPLTIGLPGCSPERAKGEVISRTLKFTVVN